MSYPSIGVVGGGIAGLSTAVELAELGYDDITIYEINDELLSGTSNAHACRASSGPHYRDAETAKKNLLATIKVLKAYPNFVLGKDKPGGEFLQQCLYLVTRDSQLSQEGMEDLLTELREFYSSLPQEDQIFGPPEKIYPTKPCSPHLYEKYVRKDEKGKSIVVAGYLIQESFLDWFGKAKAALINKVLAHKDKIKVKTRTEVVDAKHSTNKPGFDLTLKNKQSGLVQGEPVYHDFVVNASLHNIEYLDDKVGFFVPQNSRTNRTKVMVEVNLPKELWGMSHTVFCHGPFCAFTNLGNGRGLITYEPITNVESNTALRISKLSAELLAGKISEERKFEYAEKVIRGIASEYIPEMSKATYAGIRFGIAKSDGTVDLFSPNSEHHRRLNSGVKEQQIGWVDNACIKLTYFIGNAEEVAGLVQQHTEAAAAIAKIVPKVLSTLEVSDSSSTETKSDVREKVLAHMLTKSLQMNSTPKALTESKSQAEIIRQLNKRMESKQLLNTEVRGKKYSLRNVAPSDINDTTKNELDKIKKQFAIVKHHKKTLNEEILSEAKKQGGLFRLLKESKASNIDGDKRTSTGKALSIEANSSLPLGVQRVDVHLQRKRNAILESVGREWAQRKDQLARPIRTKLNEEMLSKAAILAQREVSETKQSLFSRIQDLERERQKKHSALIAGELQDVSVSKTKHKQLNTKLVQEINHHAIQENGIKGLLKPTKLYIKSESSKEGKSVLSESIQSLEADLQRKRRIIMSSFKQEEKQLIEAKKNTASLCREITGYGESESTITGLLKSTKLFSHLKIRSEETFEEKAAEGVGRYRLFENIKQVDDAARSKSWQVTKDEYLAAKSSTVKLTHDGSEQTDLAKCRIIPSLVI